MTAHVREEETLPLPHLSGSLLQKFLPTSQLDVREVARASQLRLLIVWDCLLQTGRRTGLRMGYTSEATQEDFTWLRMRW